jgi:hypothetical protein
MAATDVDTRPHDGPSLKMRLVFAESWMGLGTDCNRIATELVQAYNALNPTQPLEVLDAKWATPEPEWERRGRGWA